MAERVFTNPKGGGSADINNAVFLLALAGGGYVTYSLALQGSLGGTSGPTSFPFQIAAQLWSVFNGGKPYHRSPATAPVTNPPSVPVGSGPGPVTHAPAPSGGGGSPDPSWFKQVQPPSDNPGWYWVYDQPGYMFLWGADVNDGANWWYGGVDWWTAQTGWNVSQAAPGWAPPSGS